MSFAQFTKINLSFGDRDILKDASINLASGTKAALTGSNGCGKSTLLKIMAGILPFDSGERAVEKNCRIGYLPQSDIVQSGLTLLEEASKGFSFGYEIEAKLEKIGEELKNNPAKSDALVEKYHKLQTSLEEMDWYRKDALLEQVLLGLGFEKADFQRKVEEFSGGRQMRIALSKVLLSQSDILLLDEPTNYLDIEARTWLEKFLSDYKGGFLLVSHDRYFLDVTVNEVYELFGGSLNRYEGNYTKYEKTRQIELESLIHRYELQQNEIHKLEDFINRFGAKATKAQQAQERQKMLDKILENKIEIPENLKRIHFSFPEAPHSGNVVMTISDLSKTWRSVNKDGSVFENHVINNLSLTLEKGTRLVVVGKNGAGKSTLLRIISGLDSDFVGTVKLGAGVKIGYFSQDSAETLKGKTSIIDFLEQDCPLALVPKLRDMLGAFLFRGDDVFKSIDVLSGGEKSRIALLRLLLRPVNLLILDEPTNHLDLHSKDVLLDAIKDFGGTVVFVSHDRGFIEALSNNVLELNCGKERFFPGGYSYYLEQIEKQTFIDKTDSISFTENCTKSENQRNREETKKLQAEKRRLEKEEAFLIEQIEKCESEKRILENELSKTEIYTDGVKCKEIGDKIKAFESEIASLNAKWEIITEKLTALS